MSGQSPDEKQLSVYELRDFIPKVRELVEPGKATIVKVPELRVVKTVEDDNTALDELYDLPYGVGYLAVLANGGIGLMTPEDWHEWDGGRHAIGTKLDLIDEFLASHPRLAARWSEIYERLTRAAEAEGRTPSDPFLHGWADVETKGQLTGDDDGRLRVLANAELDSDLIRRFRSEGGEAIEEALADQFAIVFTW